METARLARILMIGGGDQDAASDLTAGMMGAIQRSIQTSCARLHLRLPRRLAPARPKPVIISAQLIGSGTPPAVTPTPEFGTMSAKALWPVGAPSSVLTDQRLNLHSSGRVPSPVEGM